MDKNVPQWIIDSKTDAQTQNDEVGLIVASFIGAFRKRGFEEKEIGIMMAQAFLLPLEEAEKRVDAVLNCDEKADLQASKNLCLFLAQRGALFSTEQADPCDLITLLKAMYGGAFAFESLLVYPELLSNWKKKEVRNSKEFASQKAVVDNILDELERVYKS